MNDRRRHRVRALLALVLWRLLPVSRTTWTEEDQVDYELEIAAWKWRTP